MEGSNQKNEKNFFVEDKESAKSKKDELTVR